MTDPERIRELEAEVLRLTRAQEALQQQNRRLMGELDAAEQHVVILQGSRNPPLRIVRTSWGRVSVGNGVQYALCPSCGVARITEWCPPPCNTQSARYAALAALNAPPGTARADIQREPVDELNGTPPEGAYGFLRTAENEIMALTAPSEAASSPQYDASFDVTLTPRIIERLKECVDAKYYRGTHEYNELMEALEPPPIGEAASSEAGAFIDARFKDPEDPSFQ